ncbi:MAG: CRISPR-associated protein Cas5 [Candidatus Aenigmatarchaeota archaeon]
MKAIVVRIAFFEAFFKVHYTKTSRLTYPIPLPTSVAGIFGSMLGLSRRDASQRFKEYFFGASLVNGDNYREARENATYILHKKTRGKGVENIHIINEPTYFISIAGEDLNEIYTKLKKNIEYLPFGGQNDFFVKDWEVVKYKDTSVSTEISNYLPLDWFQPLQDVRFEILPVMHKLSPNPDFVFILDGKGKSQEKILVCEFEGKNIGLYKLEGFYCVGEWSI